MNTPSLPFDLSPDPVRRRHKAVRPTSVTAYAKGRDAFTGRKATVLRWLAAYWNRNQESPTSAELANSEYPANTGMWFEHLLYVRRGLSDLQRATKTIQSVVERVPGGDRICRVTGERCCTWRVIERGTRRN